MIISVAHAAEAAGAHAVHFWQNPSFWVGVSFFLVIGLAFKKVSAAITAGLDTRRDKIKARLDEAHRLREDAQEMLVTYQRKQRDAMKEAEDILAHAKAEAQRMAEQAARDLEASMKRREQQAMDRIAQAEAQALAEVRNLAVDVAMAAARTVIAESMSGKQASALVDQSIADLQGKLH